MSLWSERLPKVSLAHRRSACLAAACTTQLQSGNLACGYVALEGAGRSGHNFIRNWCTCQVGLKKLKLVQTNAQMFTEVLFNTYKKDRDLLPITVQAQGVPKHVHYFLIPASLCTPRMKMLTPYLPLCVLGSPRKRPGWVQQPDESWMEYAEGFALCCRCLAPAHAS